VIDQAVAAAQIGRPLRAEVAVAARCHLDLPVVVAVPPLLDDGTPFPTRLWLSCPLAVARVSRLESAGGVQRLDAFIKTSPELTAALEAAHHRYAAERDAHLPAEADPAPQGGVGGTQGGGLKWLHAHYADTAAGNSNPVGEAVRPFVEPLDCSVPCINTSHPGAVRNPDWEEHK
jgi:hypothetical protein